MTFLIQRSISLNRQAVAVAKPPIFSSVRACYGFSVNLPPSAALSTAQLVALGSLCYLALAFRTLSTAVVKSWATWNEWPTSLGSVGMELDSLDDLIEIDMEIQHKGTIVFSAAVAKVAEGLPALGIVVAVLGVVLTMAKISEPPEVLGHSLGVALVGTLLGVLLS
ncbi:hypothetical protein DFAR_750012 [Desulfarculales bacterium]